MNEALSTWMDDSLEIWIREPCCLKLLLVNFSSCILFAFSENSVNCCWSADWKPPYIPEDLFLERSKVTKINLLGQRFVNMTKQKQWFSRFFLQKRENERNFSRKMDLSRFFWQNRGCITLEQDHGEIWRHFKTKMAASGERFAASCSKKRPIIDIITNRILWNV